MENTHDLLVGTLSIGIPSIVVVMQNSYSPSASCKCG